MAPGRVTVRPVRPEDRDAIIHICLLTAHEGKSAASLVTIPELPALVWALPYVNLPTGFGFVMVEESTDEDTAASDDPSNNTVDAPQSREKVVGYIVGTSDTAAYELAAEEQWWPALRALYPYPDEQASDAHGLTSHDRHYMNLIHSGTHAPRDVLAFSGATVHIDILPEHQGGGWGRHLLHLAVRQLQRRGADGLWVGSSGEEGRKFYRKVGFKQIRDKFLGLRFEEFVPPQKPLMNTRYP